MNCLPSLANFVVGLLLSEVYDCYDEIFIRAQTLKLGQKLCVFFLSISGFEESNPPPQKKKKKKPNKTNNNNNKKFTTIFNFFVPTFRKPILRLASMLGRLEEKKTTSETEFQLVSRQCNKHK